MGETKNGDRIQLYFECTRCLSIASHERGPNWSRFEVGLTSSGNVQVWCKQHQSPVIEFTPLRDA